MCIRWISLLVWLIFHFAGWAQDTESVTRKFPHSPQPAEHYHVLRSNKLLKHGDYVSYFQLDKKQYKSLKTNPDSLEHYIRQQGAYVRGKKHGTWKEFSAPGMLYASGSYDMDRKVGVWITAREQGEVLEKFDHDTRQKLIPEIRIPVRYPSKSRNAGVEGSVLLEFMVSADCMVNNVTVLQSVNPDCDREAIRVLRRYYEWMNRYGPPCASKRDTFRVTFRLE